MYLNYQLAEPTNRLIWCHWNNLMGGCGHPVLDGRSHRRSRRPPDLGLLGSNSVTVTVRELLLPAPARQVCLWKDGDVRPSASRTRPVRSSWLADPLAGDMYLTVTKQNEAVPGTIPCNAELIVAYNASTMTTTRRSSSGTAMGS